MAMRYDVRMVRRNPLKQVITEPEKMKKALKDEEIIYVDKPVPSTLELDNQGKPLKKKSKKQR